MPSFRRRRRWPWVLLTVVVVVVVIVVAADFAGRYVAQDAIASKVKGRTKAASVSATIRSFPFIFDAAAQGRVDRVDVVAHDVPAGPVTLATVRLSATGVRLDRSQLLPWTDGPRRPVQAVGRATVTAQLNLSDLQSDLASRAGLQVSTSGSSSVVLSAGGVVLDTIHLTDIPIVPNCPLQMTHTGNSYTFTCTVSPVPQSVINALSGR